MFSTPSLGKLAADSITIANGSKISFSYSGLNNFIPTNTDYLLTDSNTLNIDPDQVTILNNSIIIKMNLKVVGNQLFVFSGINDSIAHVLDDTDYNNVRNILDNNSIKMINTNLELMKTELVKMTNMSQFKEAVGTLAVSKNNMIQMTSSNIIDKVNGAIDSRISALNYNVTGFAPRRSKWNKNGLWGQVFSSKVNRGTVDEEKGTTDQQDGYRANINGFAFGFDHLLRGKGKKDFDSTIGLTFAYAKANTRDTSLAAREADIDSYQVALYNGNYKKNGLGIYTKNIINVAHNRYESRRNIVAGSFSTLAHGKFYGTHYGAKSEFGYNHKLSKVVLVSPHASLSYHRLNLGNYQETDAGNLGLNVVNKKDYETLVSDIGLKTTKKIRLTRYRLFPSLDVSWSRNLVKSRQESITSFIAGGNDVANVSYNIPKDILNIGAELNIMHNKRDESVILKYDLQKATKFISNTISVDYRLSF